MPDVLDGCDVRLNRAVVHLKTLQEIVETHNVDPDPTDNPLFRLNADFERGKLEVVVARDAEMPDIIGVVFGEIIRGLHATLDNFVYALGSTHSQIPRDDRRSAFPILVDADKWFTPETAGKLHFLAPQERAFIEQLQPFMEREGRKPHNDVLARIAAFSNKDKHQIIVPTAAATLSQWVDLIESQRCTVSEPDLPDFVRLRKHAVVVSTDLTVTGPKPYVRVKGGIRFVPVLEHNEAVQSFCEGAIGYVRLIIQAARDRWL